MTNTKCSICNGDLWIQGGRKYPFCQNCDEKPQRTPEQQERDRQLNQTMWDILTLPYKHYGIKVPETPFGRKDNDHNN